jgi:RNA polymerase sigma-32 factor
MSIDAQFMRFAFRPAMRELAFVRDGIGKGYLHDIRRFEMLERDQEYNLARRWREHG